MAAEDRLRHVALGRADGRETAVALRDVDVPAHEIDLVGPEHHERRHPRVVIVVARDVAVGALLGFRASHV